LLKKYLALERAGRCSFRLDFWLLWGNAKGIDCFVLKPDGLILFLLDEKRIQKNQDFSTRSVNLKTG
ncbi:hypothetical protein KDU71_22415, partial [Carboxylicivirga sediminis]